MANANYNTFIAIVISEQYQLFGVNSDYTTTPISEQNFSHQVTISEDGTLWALSMIPDPEDGGSKLFYSQSVNNWNEIKSPSKGVFKIAGGQGSTCFFTDGDGSISNMTTAGTSTKYFEGRTVLELGAGGGMVWAVYGTNQDGDIPKLHYASWNSPLIFKEFKKISDVTPTSLSVSSRGDCYGIIYARPWFYRHDGSNSGAVAEGVDDITLQISWKEASFILTTDCNEEGNLVMQMGAPGAQSYDYGSINLRGIKVLSTFHKKDS